MNRDAVISSDGLYRYRLDRDWRTPLDRELNARSRGAVLFVMLNPSTADAQTDDPTIRRCVDFAQRWGHDRLIVCNLFALRATDPRALELTKFDPTGPLNGETIHRASTEATRVVFAWGASGAALGERFLFARDQAVKMATFDCPVDPEIIGPPTKDGHPRHPLYLSANEALRPWRRGV